MRIKNHLLVIFLLTPSLISGSRENLSPDREDDQTTNEKNEQSELDPDPVGRRDTVEYPDTNNYFEHPMCGDKPLGHVAAACHCGTETLSAYGDLAFGDSFCLLLRCSGR